MNNVIKQHIYKENKNRKGTKVIRRKKIGVLVAGRINNEVAIGFSLCNNKDEFNRIDGKKVPGHAEKIALTRAKKKIMKGREYPLPHSIRKQYRQFEHRCGLYYKDATII
jgi:hypothetical protein